MRVFVYEYLCGGAATGVPSSLRSEGWAMLSAVLEDLCRCPGVEVFTRIDPELATAKAWPKNLTLQLACPDGEEGDFRQLARKAKYTLLIAPESHDILATRCRWVEEVGGCLLGPSSEAVRLTADKLRLAEFLTQKGVPTPPTVPWSPEAAVLGFPLVVKPRDGAGSQATFLVHNETELLACPDRARAEGWDGELVAQCYVEGQAASVSVVVGPGGKFCFRPCRQLLSSDGRLRYLGGEAPLPDELAAAAKALAVRALPVLPGLRGWFGVDVVLHPTKSWLIEINPRLSTSYVGLRRLAKFNLMEMLLAVASSQSLPLVEWRNVTVAFAADGATTESPG